MYAIRCVRLHQLNKFMPYLPPVPQGKIKLGASWFRSVRDRVEEIKPLEGQFIGLRQTPDGIIINAKATLTLNVCRDGAPATITVVGI